MITITKSDGIIDIELTNGLEPGSSVSLNTITCYIRINNGKWIKSPFRSSYRTRQQAESATTVHIFKSIIAGMMN